MVDYIHKCFECSHRINDYCRAYKMSILILDTDKCTRKGLIGGLNIIVDPPEVVIDSDDKKSDLLVLVHKEINHDDLNDVVKRLIATKNKPVYIHFYTGSKTYTIGVKKSKN